MRSLVVVMLIAAFGLFIPSGECLRTSPDAKTPEEARSKADEDLKRMLREREISKRVADKRIREKEAEESKRAETVEVRVHAGGTDPLAEDHAVILTTEMSKEDLKAKNFKEIHRRAQESRMAYRQNRDPSAASESRAPASSPSPERQSNGPNAGTIVFLGALGAGGWWYLRQKGTA